MALADMLKNSMNKAPAIKTPSPPVEDDTPDTSGYKQTVKLDHNDVLQLLKTGKCEMDDGTCVEADYSGGDDKWKNGIQAMKDVHDTGDDETAEGGEQDDEDEEPYQSPMGDRVSSDEDE